MIFQVDWQEPDFLPLHELVALFAQAGFAPPPEALAMPAHIPATTFFFPKGPKEASSPLVRGFILVFHKPAQAL